MTDLKSPALADLGFLVGNWDMALSRASFLSDPNQVLHGRVEIEPIEGGAFLAIRQVADASGPPLATWVIGRDAAAPGYTVLYGDSRHVSRVYSMSFDAKVWRLWREDPEFSQRFEATVNSDGSSIGGRWEKRSANGSWEHDFEVVYSRAEDPSGL